MFAFVAVVVSSIIEISFCKIEGPTDFADRLKSLGMLALRMNRFLLYSFFLKSGTLRFGFSIFGKVATRVVKFFRVSSLLILDISCVSIILSAARTGPTFGYVLFYVREPRPPLEEPTIVLDLMFVEGLKAGMLLITHI